MECHVNHCAAVRDLAEMSPAAVLAQQGWHPEAKQAWSCPLHLTCCSRQVQLFWWEVRRMRQGRKVTQRDETPAKTEPGPSELLCGVVKRQNASHTSREVDCCKKTRMQISDWAESPQTHPFVKRSHCTIKNRSAHSPLAC